jgi:hypothetical protein
MFPLISILETELQWRRVKDGYAPPEAVLEACSLEMNTRITDES